jgi:hypothetical protein
MHTNNAIKVKEGIVFPVNLLVIEGIAATIEIFRTNAVIHPDPVWKNIYLRSIIYYFLANVPFLVRI